MHSRDQWVGAVALVGVDVLLTIIMVLHVLCRMCRVNRVCCVALYCDGRGYSDVLCPKLKPLVVLLCWCVVPLSPEV